MSGTELATTALMLGGFALAGGAYGLLFAVSKLKQGHTRRRLFLRGSWVCYALQLASVAAICTLTPLALSWKLFVVASGLAYGALPPLAWQLMERLHRDEVSYS